MLTLHTVGTSEATMSSREIADICEARHNDVVATIERLINEGVLRLGRNTARLHTPDGGGRPTMVYDLTKRDCLIVVSGYSAVLRARIIDRWIELETRPAAALPDFSNPAEAARAWAAQYEARAALESKVAADAPKVAFAEAVRAIDGACHIEKIGKALSIGRNKFFKRLRADGILLDNNLPYQKYIDRGYFTVIEQQPYTDTKGVTHATFTTMVTGAGQVFLAKRYANIAGGANA
jgi:phage antirepressor YoqD-like protein